MKTIWLRLGVNMEITEEEEKKIFQDQNLKEVLLDALSSGRITLDGDTYIPDSQVELFNSDHSTEYEINDYSCNM